MSLSLTVILLSACEEESDMAFDRVAAPVTLEYTAAGDGEALATFFELDKSGILDQNIGIVQTPVPNLEIEVSIDGTVLGTFTTSSDGSILLPYTESAPDEFAGIYNDVAFRIFRNSFD